MTIGAATDFGSIGQALALIVIAFMTYWNKRKSDKRDKAVAEIKKVTENTAVKVEEVHKFANGGMGDQLLIGMVSAQTLAEVSPSPEHQSLADVARTKYETHMTALRKIAMESTQADIWNNKNKPL